jgi:NhaP-type Na+/H+ or K+/H+ antiporter
MDLFHNLHDPFYPTLALLGLFILLFGLISLFVKERLYLTESLVAILFGILFGPLCIGIIDPMRWFSEENFYRMLMEFSRIIISFQVMAVGLCTPLYVHSPIAFPIFLFYSPLLLFSLPVCLNSNFLASISGKSGSALPCCSVH